ncbi:ribonuclease Y [bacterium E08(2017)]|nr:ribonuclease Y [bacterium E08(2017)]
MNDAVIGISVGIVCLAIGYMIRFVIGNYKAESAETRAKEILKDAKRQQKALQKEGEVEAKAEVLKAKEEFEQSTRTKKEELLALEEKINQRETNLDRKVTMLDKKESTLDQKLSDIEAKEQQLEQDRAEIEEQKAKQMQKLQQISGMSQDEARESLLSTLKEQVHNEAGGLIRRMQENAKDTAERQSQKIVALAIQKYSSTHATELMTSSVALPNDDMKGRIIGREGRNIRSLEAVTGVNILIDDTPEAVVISGFDPIRREIARQALEKLIGDGRIHPARIEEVVAKIEESMDETIRTAGEEAEYQAGVQGVEPELTRMLGRLKFRTSFTQNVLQHAIEVSSLMGVMAGELNLDVSLAKRIGLFHDIGKALDHEVEGGHAVIGADLLKRMNESPTVVNAVAAHHEEVEAESVYALLAAAADAISCSRLGARSETTSVYVKRLEQLEQLANTFEGVQKSYAIHAGREVRILVDPDNMDDNKAQVLARDISSKIEEDLQYPGQIRVVVIRETRSVDYAR